MKFQKLKPRMVTYRDYSKFEDTSFINDLNYHLYNPIALTYSNFKSIFETIINRHAPVKTKFLRANNKPHMTKSLRKAIMLRSRLKNKANRSQLPEDLACYRTQRNLVVNLNRKAKKAFIDSISPGNGHKFWKTFKPLFLDKGNDTVYERIQISEGDSIILN